MAACRCAPARGKTLLGGEISLRLQTHTHQIMRILELDLGNSRTKWRLADLGLSGSLPSDELIQLKALPADWAGLIVDSIWLASVLADAATQAAVGSLQRVFACDVHRAYSSPAAAG